MRPRIRRLAIVMVGSLAWAALAIKLFTVEVRYADDPTIGVALRAMPSLENFEEIKDEERAFILGPDENSYLGRGLYVHTVGWIWWVSLLGLLSLLVSLKLTRTWGIPGQAKSSQKM